MTRPTCPSCGARLAPEAERCTLCGLPQDEELSQDDLATSPPAEEGAAQQASPAAPAQAGPAAEPAGVDPVVYCPQCGTDSPPVARYCWKCGHELSAGLKATSRPISPPSVPIAAPAAEEVPASGSAGRQGVLLVAGAIAAVVLLFAITQISGRTDPLRPQIDQDSPQPPAAVLPAEISDHVERLEQQLSASNDGAERLALRQELVDVLVNAGAFVRAGELQEAIAREVQTVDAWAEAGSFFLAHVLRASSPEQVIFAQRSAQAFEQALALRPEDLDIKTDLATAYRYHPDDPMRAVTLIQEVLEQAPDHPRARFNYGVMLAEIGRTEQARTQFEHIISTPAADEFVQERAREMLATMGS